ncbi:hypothetical protein MNBD_ALPHA01-1471 [hydrothermal vent metagenome]|uniref:Uncharacterized protein n=1 Tax=hydrothermal vent metagenome TaxID=652676 RepID=A0A3B0RKG9_9ZZZZ
MYKSLADRLSRNITAEEIVAYERDDAHILRGVLPMAPGDILIQHPGNKS